MHHQMKVDWFSPAKINLFLYVLGKRFDGYHKIQTFLQFLDYGDKIKIVPRKDGMIRLLNSVKGIPDEKNLIIQAAKILKTVNQKFNSCGADILISKRIPIGGGLGGGSSNAATVLVALNKLWHCNLNVAELMQLGLQIGTDVPVFIKGQASFVEGIGEIITPIKFPERWYLIVYPKIEIKTEKIFNDPHLPRNTPARSIDMIFKDLLKNDFEEIVRRRFKKVDAAFHWLLQYTKFPRLTGTGSCVFSEFTARSEASFIMQKTPRWLTSFIAKGKNVSPLISSI